jgi:hypothetical protein
LRNVYQSEMKKKLFISHASEDKDDFVRPLAKALSEDFDVWYDEHQLVVGCSLLEEISKGLANCDFGVVVLSEHFFAKNWPQKELNGLFALEEKDKKVILPVWKGVSKEDVVSYSPILADRIAAKAEDGVDKVVNEIMRSIAYFDRGRSVEKRTNGLNKLRTSLEKKTEKERSKSIVWSEAGVSIAINSAKQTINILADQVRSLLQHGSITGLRIDGPKGNQVHYWIDVWIGKICLRFEYVNSVVNSAMDARMHVAMFQADNDRWGHASKSTVFKKESYSLYVDINDNSLWKDDHGQLVTPDQLVDAWLENLSARI